MAKDQHGNIEVAKASQALPKALRGSLNEQQLLIVGCRGLWVPVWTWVPAASRLWANQQCFLEVWTGKPIANGLKHNSRPMQGCGALDLKSVRTVPHNVRDLMEEEEEEKGPGGGGGEAPPAPPPTPNFSAYSPQTNQHTRCIPYQLGVYVYVYVFINK